MLDLTKLYQVGSKLEEVFLVDSDDTVGQFSPKLSSLLSTAGLTNRLLKTLRDFCDQDLPEGYVSVARAFNVTHLETVMIGTPLRVTVELVALEGNKLRIDCIISDALGPVAHARTERAIVAHDLLLQETENRRVALADLEDE